MADYVAIVEALRDEYRQKASWSRGTVDGRNVNDDKAAALDALLLDAQRYRTIRRGGLPVIERGFYMLAISQACDAAVDRMEQDQDIIDAAMEAK